MISKRAGYYTATICPQVIRKSKPNIKLLGWMKEVYIIAGPNGSGKTTLADKLVKSQKLPFVNADEIEKDISRDKVESMKIQAGKIYLRQIHEYIKDNRSFVMETTFSGKTTGRINQLKTSGYNINICYLVVESPDVAIKRIAERVKSGGHNIPEEDVIRRFYRSKKNFWHIYKQLSHEWEIFYNGGNEILPVARGSNDEWMVINSEYFTIFMEGIESYG